MHPFADLSSLNLKPQNFSHVHTYQHSYQHQTQRVQPRQPTLISSNLNKDLFNDNSVAFPISENIAQVECPYVDMRIHDDQYLPRYTPV